MLQCADAQHAAACRCGLTRPTGRRGPRQDYMVLLCEITFCVLLVLYIYIEVRTGWPCDRPVHPLSCAAGTGDEGGAVA